jgi:hypothetical protein
MGREGEGFDADSVVFRKNKPVNIRKPCITARNKIRFRIFIILSDDIEDDENDDELPPTLRGSIFFRFISTMILKLVASLE